MKTRRSASLFYGALLILILASACQPSVPATVTLPPSTYTPVPPPTHTPTATVLPEPTATVLLPFPTGKFTRPSDETDYFTFRDGRWAHYVGGQRGASGTYSVEGDIYIQTGNSAGCTVPMRYAYTFDGSWLHFELTEQSRVDSCADRASFYDNRTYRLAP